MIKPSLSLFALVLSCGNGVTIAQESGSGRPVFYGISDGREPSASVTNAPYYDDKERGWFWYEEPVSAEEMAETPAPPPDIAPIQEKKVEPRPVKPQETKPLSAEWFRKNMEKFRDKAVDEPTPENVSAYLYLQRVMLDKAERFAEASQQVTMADPVLDENSRRPIATFGAFAKDEMATLGTAKAAKKLAESAGLWFFYSSTCTFCAKEAGVLRGLMNAYGFKILPIALDGLPLPTGDFPNFTLDQGQAKKLGVETTPALFLVKPGTNGGAIQLAQGLLSGDDIVNRAITLSHQQGWLSSDQYQETRKVNPLQVDTKTINGMNEETVNNPAELIKTIRNNLKTKL